MRVLGLIPARGGSKGVPEKNVRPMAGKSLVQRAYECGRAAGVVDRIVLSTDHPGIAAAATSWGLEVPFLRPPELAADDTPMLDVALHALHALAATGYEADALLLLQPTSPLRRPEHIRRAVALLVGDADAVCSVTPLPRELCPHFVMRITHQGFVEFFLPEGARYTRRQDVPQAYRRDGLIYLTRTSVLRTERTFYGKRCVPMVVDAADALNIDCPDQWADAERRVVALEQPTAVV